MNTSNTPLKNVSTENMVRWGIIALVAMVALITAVIVGPKLIQGTKATSKVVGEAGGKAINAADQAAAKSAAAANGAVEKASLESQRLDIGDDLEKYVQSLGPTKELTRYEIFDKEMAIQHERDAFESGGWDQATIETQRKKVNDWLAALGDKEGYALLVYIRDTKENWEYPFPVLATKTESGWKFE